MTSVTVAATGEDHSPQAGSAGQDADHDRKDQTTGKSSRLSLVMMVDISRTSGDRGGTTASRAQR